MVFAVTRAGERVDLDTMKSRRHKLAVLSIFAAVGCTAGEGSSLEFRGADVSDEELAIARSVELSEEHREAVDRALSDEEIPDVGEPDEELVRHAGELVAELAELDLRSERDVARAEDLRLQLTEILVSLSGPVEYETLDIPGPLYCYYAASFTPLVRSFASLTETLAKVSHQLYGASYSWVTWFMTIAARVDADDAVDLAAQNILFNAQDVKAVLLLVADEEDEAATFGWNSYNNSPNTYASGAAQLAESTRDLAKKVGDWAGKCSI